MDNEQWEEAGCWGVQERLAGNRQLFFKTSVEIGWWDWSKKFR